MQQTYEEKLVKVDLVGMTKNVLLNRLYDIEESTKTCFEGDGYGTVGSSLKEKFTSVKAIIGLVFG